MRSAAGASAARSSRRPRAGIRDLEKSGAPQLDPHSEVELEEILADGLEWLDRLTALFLGRPLAYGATKVLARRFELADDLHTRGGDRDDLHTPILLAALPRDEASAAPMQ